MKTPLAALRNAAARVAAGTAAGGATRGATRAAGDRAVIDTRSTRRRYGGLAVGGVLGALWAAGRASRPGLVGDTVRAAGGVLGSGADRAAGDRMLSDVRKSSTGCVKWRASKANCSVWCST